MAKKKIRGTILCHFRDEFGEMIVADDGPERALYFGDGILQSTIRKDQPATLLELYNQAMMTALIFKKEPKSVLMVGLGGCSLVHFLLDAFPACRIDVIEIRKQVIDAAFEYFMLPKENANLHVFHMGGEDFINQESGHPEYDLILIDAFDDNGPASALLEKDFLTRCKQRLTEDGICVYNIWHRPKDQFPAFYSRLRKTFAYTLRLHPAENYWNLILFGFNRTITSNDISSFRPVAKELNKRFGINLPKLFRNLCWQNFG